MVSKENSKAGSKGENSCVKTQKNMVNSLSLSSSTEHAQRSRDIQEENDRVIYSDDYGENATTTNQPMSSLCHPKKHNGAGNLNPVEAVKNCMVQTGTAGPIRDQEAYSEISEPMEKTDQTSSGPDDKALETPETLTDRSCSTLVFTDKGPEEVRIFPDLDGNMRTEIVLIDEDDDMSLREKTVTDASLMDGNAAELVCGRLLSISSSESASECKEETLDMETPLPVEPPPKERSSCCLCTIL